MLGPGGRASWWPSRDWSWWDDDRGPAGYVVDVLSQPVLIVLAVGWIGGFGLAAARMAKGLDRLQVVWFIFGVILGPVALLLLNAAPPGRCRTCGTPSRGWGGNCWWCHEDVRLANPAVLAMAGRTSRRVAEPRAPIQQPLPRRPQAARPFAIRSDGVQAPAPAYEEPTPPVTAVLTAKTWHATVEAPLPGRTSEPSDSRPASGDIKGRARPAPAPKPAAGDRMQVIATAVFVVGSARLEPGRRYGLALRSTRLLVLGPTDVDPSAIILDRPAAEVEVRSVEGRLVISEPRSGSGLVLAFMSVAGATTAEIATLITDATQA